MMRASILVPIRHVHLPMVRRLSGSDRPAGRDRVENDLHSCPITDVGAPSAVLPVRCRRCRTRRSGLLRAGLVSRAGVKLVQCGAGSARSACRQRVRGAHHGGSSSACSRRSPTELRSPRRPDHPVLDVARCHMLLSPRDEERDCSCLGLRRARGGTGRLLDAGPRTEAQGPGSRPQGPFFAPKPRRKRRRDPMSRPPSSWGIRAHRPGRGKRRS